VERIVEDYETAELSEKRLAMLRYADKLTRTPAQMTEADVEVLGARGFSDTDILHIAEVVGYFAYVNRIADGLGVPLEDWVPDK
jgi:uncharacterized peroxidase-related enzyme